MDGEISFLNRFPYAYLYTLMLAIFYFELSKPCALAGSLALQS